MSKKKKAFTLIELIITLSLTTIILGGIYTFFITNTKSLSNIDINSELQMEAQNIQKEFLNYCTQSEEITEINDIEINDNNKILYKDILDLNTGKIDITNIKFRLKDEYFNFIFDKNLGILSLKAIDKDKKNIDKYNLPKILSNNVKELKMRPLDFRSNPEGSLKEASGIEILIILNKKKGYSEVETPSSLIVKFRNKK